VVLCEGIRKDSFPCLPSDKAVPNGLLSGLALIKNHSTNLWYVIVPVEKDRGLPRKCALSESSNFRAFGAEQDCQQCSELIAYLLVVYRYLLDHSTPEIVRETEHRARHAQVAGYYV
jgi:hypothetical protein